MMSHHEKQVLVEPGSDEMMLSWAEKSENALLFLFSLIFLSFTQWASKTKDKGFDLLASLNLTVYDNSQITADYLI